LKAARHGELDAMRGVSANVMCGQQGYFGTSAFQVLADINAMMEHEVDEYTDEPDNILDDAIIDGTIIDGTSNDDKCGINNLTINNNAINIKNVDLGQDDDYEIEF